MFLVALADQQSVDRVGLVGGSGDFERSNASISNLLGELVNECSTTSKHGECYSPSSLDDLQTPLEYAHFVI